MSLPELHYATIEELAPRMKARDLSPIDLTEAVLARIGQLDHRLGAFITVMADQARADAKRAEQEIGRGDYRGPLHGIPVSLKDLYDTAGVRTTSGSKILADHVPEEDAFVVARLRQAGAVIVGKANLHEFAFGPTGINAHYGVTRNPWNTEHVPGGSSGGSGVAVATGMGCVSMGTDTGGSIRIPAALSGTVGLKPTYGRVSRRGIFPLAYSLDHAGPLTRSVRDAAFVLDAIAGHDPRDPGSADLSPPALAAGLSGDVNLIRAGVLKEGRDAAEPEVQAVFDAAIDRLRAAGLSIENVSVPEALSSAGALGGVIHAEAAAVHQRWLAERPDDYDPQVRARLELGALLPAVHYIKAQQARRAMMAAFQEIWRRLDVLLLPAVPIVAPAIEGSQELHIRNQLTSNTRIFNVTGAPACSVPCGFTRGLPVGLMVAGRPFDERSVLQVSLAYEQATDWRNQRPPVG